MKLALSTQICAAKSPDLEGVLGVAMFDMMEKQYDLLGQYLESVQALVEAKKVRKNAANNLLKDIASASKEAKQITKTVTSCLKEGI